MISLIQSIPAGNALRIFLDVPHGAEKCRLLRKVSNTFSGFDDPDALIVSSEIVRSALDINGLVNNTLYYYKDYYYIMGGWIAGVTVSATPSATYKDLVGDVLSLVRDRLDLGLQVELGRGVLSHDNNHIPVLTAPPIFEDVQWPIVTVHLQNEQPAERGIGEIIGVDVNDDDTGDWDEAEGWLARVQLTIMGWSLNPDERILIRTALRRIVLSNLSIFDAAGMVQIDFSQQDTEDFGSYGAPVYQAMCTFSCLAPVMVGSSVNAISDVQVTILE